MEYSSGIWDLKKYPDPLAEDVATSSPASTLGLTAEK
jgi:hypothetical protein